MNNIMLDIETLSTKPNAVIMQIAAVKFEFGSDKIEKFEVNCNIKSSIDLGLHVDPKTVDWWKSKPPEQLVTISKNSQPIFDCIQQFSEFVGNPNDMVLWSNGNNFDFPIIESTCDMLGIRVPWNYWNLRDARTVYAVFGLDFKTYPRVGTYHNAIDDCLTQIKALKECLS